MMATADGFNTPAVGYKEMLSLSRDKCCPLLLLDKPSVGQTRLSGYFTCVQVWPVS